jgi:hypothetical protein
LKCTEDFLFRTGFVANGNDVTTLVFRLRNEKGSNVRGLDPCQKAGYGRRPLIFVVQGDFLALQSLAFFCPINYGENYEVNYFYRFHPFSKRSAVYSE